MDDGRVGHAELAFGEVVLMLADEFPEMGLVSPRSQEGHSSSLSLYVPDVDATYAHALDRGATGERSAGGPLLRRAGRVVPGPVRSPVERPDRRWRRTRRCRPGPTTSPPPAPSAPPAGRGPGADRLAAVERRERAGLLHPHHARRRPWPRPSTGRCFGWAADVPTPTEDGRHRYRHVGNTTAAVRLRRHPDSPSPDHYYRVDDLQAMVARVRDLGGEVVSVAEYESGGNAVCKDDQGTVFQLWQPAPGY